MIPAWLSSAPGERLIAIVVSLAIVVLATGCGHATRIDRLHAEDLLPLASAAPPVAQAAALTKSEAVDAFLRAAPAGSMLVVLRPRSQIALERDALHRFHVTARLCGTNEQQPAAAQPLALDDASELRRIGVLIAPAVSTPARLCVTIDRLPDDYGFGGVYLAGDVVLP